MNDPRPLKRSSPEFRLIPIDEIEAPADSPYIVRGLLPRTGLAVVYGPPGCGKSFLALDVALHIADGRPWAGCRVNEVGVVYVAAEAGEGFKRRVIAARERLGVHGSSFALMTAAPNLGAQPGDTNAFASAIRAQCYALGWRPGIVVLDTLARVIPGVDENSSREMGRFISNAEAISRSLHCLVLAIHHVGKNSESGMRGSSALHGASDVEWSIVNEDGVRTIKLAKSKEGADDLSWTFCLEVVQAGVDEDGEPITTCVVANVSEPTFANGRKPVKSTTIPSSQRLLFASLDDALVAFGETVRPFGSSGSEVLAVRRERVRDAYFRAHPADNDGAKKTAFNRALNAAAAAKLIISADLSGATFVWRP